MAKLKSSLNAYFINIGTVASPTWARLGKGVTSIPVSYNPQVTTENYVDADNAESSVDSYQVSSAIDVSLHDAEAAPAHAYLEELRTTRAVGDDAETQILEIDISGDSPYPAQLNNAVVAVDTFTIEGGKPQQLSVTIYYNGDPTEGTAVVTDGVPVFTPTGVSALALSSISPVDGASGVSTGSSIVLTFNNKIRSESIVVTKADGTIVAVTRSWDAAHKVLTLDPDSALSSATTYLVAISGVCDIYGQQLAAAVDDFATA
jgi:methionine-rich copper-binding protein CopC